jgi:1,4-dihydroxy-2-naphthoate octaprenyltransferase
MLRGEPSSTRQQTYAAVIRDYVIHLRLHYQLLLAPTFVGAYFIAGGQIDLRFWVAFCSVHVFLIGGTNAYNSYYDRDVGPVGGLLKPPPVTQGLLPFSLVVQGVGAVLALLVNATFLGMYLTMFTMGIAYSLPRTRLKGRPLLGLVVVGLGQGVVLGLSGAATVQPDITRLDAIVWLGILFFTLVTVGFFPLTQVYQIDEDTRRGDLTFAAWAGPNRTFALAVITLAVAAIALTVVVNDLLGIGQALLVALFHTALLIAIIRWAHVFGSEDTYGNFRRLMRIHVCMSLAFLGFLFVNLSSLP